ncbi:uncharacterized protein LOC133851452 [Alnus glutinosa]|uniref:uncharacterized protein LOC133851452 n=1 Tax=Alnus glutinosa TaxID=3517 RepID=UPI002D778BBE|nr:uncharacterized protein LOC133851452 [Alnus glutinosa]
MKIEQPPIIPTRELALHNRKTIAEIKEMEGNSEVKEIFYTCLCKVERIDNKYGWYYIGCITCKTKVKFKEGIFWCERCQAEPKFSVPRYRIQIEVSDTTDSTRFIIFDKDAEQLIGKTAKELADLQDENLKDNIVPKEIEAIVSREYVFQLKLNEYNLKKGWENYTVYRIFEAQVAKEANIHKETPIVKIRGSSSKQEEEYDVVSQTIENEQMFSKDSSLHSSLPIEDTESDDDSIPLKFLYKRFKTTKKKTYH